MGICKCRNVTNLFCFEHRKNVCEKCLVSDHPRCIVRSYLQWLQDSEFDPQCALCSQSLENGGVVRLMCYDVFHWECLDKYAKSFPPHTAPAGYVCPTCQIPIIPPDNAGSLVAQQLRQSLREAPWARLALEPTSTSTLPSTLLDSTPELPKPSTVTAAKFTTPVVNGNGPSIPSAASAISTPARKNMYSNGTSDTNTIIMHDHDHDDDKYGQRRGIAHLLRQCFGIKSLKKAFFVLTGVAIIGFVIIGVSSRILRGPPIE